MREPQQDRSRVTRRRLLDATIESLAEVGWDRTTVVAVAARAGVSRGAAQHHFSTRDELVVAAVDEVRGEILADLRRHVPEVAAREDRSLAVVEMLSDIWTSTFGRAATHLWVAASTDPQLRSLVLPLERQLNQDIYRVTLELLGADASQPQVRESVGLTLQLVRGIGLGSLLRRDSVRRRSELAQWATMLAAIEGVIGRMPL
ncbi:MAG TPA: TetR/AcrR family transcriptional regulator [Nocardioidaceae bacterium]|nr:TetR/AcrR family transcriptional regulator [Nocardioidaceae bacterium]